MLAAFRAFDPSRRRRILAVLVALSAALSLSALYQYLRTRKSVEPQLVEKALEQTFAAAIRTGIKSGSPVTDIMDRSIFFASDQPIELSDTFAKIK
mgnify:CR=1 FL=1